MKRKVKKIVQDLRTALQSAIDDFEGLYVFGSQVTGKATKDSDIDIVVLMENTSYEKIGELCGIASKFDYDYDVILDVLPYTRKELENNCFFHDEVVNKGIFYSAA